MINGAFAAPKWMDRPSRARPRYCRAPTI